MSGDIKICRVCETTQNLELIFNHKIPELVEKLMLCADVQVEADDQLPKFICFKCSERVDLAYEFKIQCESTDAKWRRWLLQSELNKCKVQIEDPIAIVGADEELDEFVLDDFNDVEELIEVESVEFNENGEEEPIEQADYVEEEDESHVGHMEISIVGEYGKGSDVDAPHSNEGDEVFLLEEEPCIGDKEQNGLEHAFVVDGDSIAEALAETHKEEQSELVVIREKRLLGNQDKIFACDTCGAHFITFAEFNQHKKSHGDKRYQCPICSKWFSKKYRLKNHIQTHDGSKTFACKICGNKYTNRGNRDRHVRHFHRNERPYKCNQCGLSFSRSNILKLHLTVHIKERNFECDVCNKRFKAEYYLKLHKKSHIPVEERPETTRKTRQGRRAKLFTCSYCGKIVAGKAVHDIHVRTHTGEKPFECATCHRRFAFKQSLKSHELLHTGEKPFSCELCGLSFRQVGHLKGHMLVHSGLKNHKCKYCEKSFALKSNLIVHQRLHTGETPYHCNLCEKKFYDSNGLKRHKKSHLKEQAEMELSDVAKVEPVEEFLEENCKEYSEIVEMPAKGEVNPLTLSENKKKPLRQQDST